MENFIDLNDEEKVIICSLGALHNSPLRSKTKIQKLLFLISNVFDGYKDILEFEPHLFGPYSETVDYVLEDLIKLDLVEKSGKQYKLTDNGIKIFKCLSPKKDIMRVIEDFKEFLNDLSNNELLTFVYVSYPEYIEESAKWDELKKEREKIAISLLKKQKISFSKAVEVSGLTTSNFEKLLEKKNIRWK